jgi:WD40 repeat protein
MRRIRFSIASLLIVVLVLALGFAALRESSELWDSGVFTLALAVLVTSILLAIHRTESRRAFWTGFALFGWTYLGLSLVPSIESRLITTEALAYMDSKVPGRPQHFFRLHVTGGIPGNQVQAVAFSPQGNRLATSSPGTVRLWDATTGRLLGGWAGTTENFVRIGHSLIALIVAFLGGQVSRHLCARQEEATDGSVIP